MIIRTYAYGYTHIRVYLYAYTRIVIRTYAYIYTRIYAYTCASDVSLLFRTKTFLCVSLLWKRKSLKKRRADNRKLTYSTKLMWSYYKHARRIASCIYWITRRSSSSALSFAVDESDRKEKYYFKTRHLNAWIIWTVLQSEICKCRIHFANSPTNYRFFDTCLIIRYQKWGKNRNRRLQSLF